MKNITLTFFCLITFYSFSQSLEERKLIVSSYNKIKMDSLMSAMKEFDKNRTAKVNNYLELNPQVAKSYIGLNNNYYELIDIIDNKPIYRSTDNMPAAIAIKTNTLHPGGALGLNLEGEGMDVGVWDQGHVFKNHVEFASNSVSRVSTPDTPNPNPTANFHATHVAGTIGAAGVNSSAKGMAPKVNLLSHNWTNDETEVMFSAGQGLLVSNHSYGTPIYNDEGVQSAPNWYMGCYSTDARNWDAILHTYKGYLMVASAGNSGTESYTGGLAPGYDKLTGNKNSKNNLVVANANPTVNPITGIMSMMFINSGSSQGPTDDGRIKPDIAADGTQVFSTSNTSSTSYATASGTSMAAPGVSGTLILLQEYYRSLQDEEIGLYMNASTLKGLVCHTAMDDFQREGPDPFYGWGLLDARFAAQTITKSFNNEAIIHESTLNQGEEHTYTVNVSNLETLKATICWTDPAGVAMNNQINNATPVLVNDLDLRVFDSEGNEFFPWKLQVPNVQALAIKGDNNVDNVERVDVATPSGQYTIVVTHKGVLSESEQMYSLIVTGSDMTLSNSKYVLDNVKIWPNPAKSQLNINFGNLVNDAVVKLYDIQGRVVYNQVYKNVYDTNANINVESLANGIYTLTINSGNQVLNKKIVVN